MKKELEFEGKDQESTSAKTPAPPEKPKKLTTDEKLAKLERLIAKMCHFTGNERILDEFGIARWVPGQKDMSKHSD